MIDPALFDRLRTYGAALERWPDDLRAEARAALLADRDFRAAFESERGLDRRLGAARGSLDAEIESSGALARVRKRTLEQVPSNLLSGMNWPRIAAAICVAALLGGAVGTVLPAAADEPIEVALGDPLYVIGAEAE